MEQIEEKSQFSFPRSFWYSQRLSCSPFFLLSDALKNSDILSDASVLYDIGCCDEIK